MVLVLLVWRMLVLILPRPIPVDFNRRVVVDVLLLFIRLMIKILHYPKDPKPWELWVSSL